MGRHAVHVGDDLLAHAMRATGLPSPEAVVEHALRRVADRRAGSDAPMLDRDEALALRGSGWDPKRVGQGA